MTKIRLRPACSAERERIFDIYRTTLKPHIEWAWGWDEAFQRSAFWEHHPIEEFRVITADGEVAGGIYVEQQAGLNFLRMIFLLPAFQRRGIGSELLRGEVARASGAGKPLDLNVIKSNPAKTLYDRMGFVVIGEDHAVYHMRLI